MADPRTLDATLRQAGFRGQSLNIARAIVQAESRGNPFAHNTNAATGDDSYGDFQINMLGALGPERRARYGITSNDQLFDPLTNARVAYDLSKGGTDWSPWSTFKSGAYEKYLGGGDRGGSDLPSSPLAMAAGGGASAPAARRAFAQALLGGLNEKGVITIPAALTAAIGARRDAAADFPSPPTRPLPAPTGLYGPGQGTGKLATVGGIEVDPAISGQVSGILRAFGVRASSGYRSPEHNRQVGGAPRSDHLTGDAVDFVGSPQQIKALYAWAQKQRFPYVEPLSQSRDHAHISFRR